MDTIVTVYHRIFFHIFMPFIAYGTARARFLVHCLTFSFLFEFMTLLFGMFALLQVPEVPSNRHYSDFG